MNYSIGDKVQSVSNYMTLTPKDIVTVIKIEPGIFPGDTYVTIQTEDLEKVTGFDWRFKKL